LLAVATSDTEIQLNWTDTSSDETYFLIEQSLDDSIYTQVTTVNIDVNSYLVTGLQPETLYFFRVSSYNQGGTNGSFAKNSEMTESTPQIPNTPSNFIAVSNSSSTINCSWNDVTAEDIYVLEWKKTTDTEWSSVNLGANSTSYQITGLLASTPYNTRIKASNSFGASAYVTYNATTQSGVVQTDEPTINNVVEEETSISFTVRNNDSSTALIRVDYNDSSPDRKSETVVGGGNASFSFTNLTPD
jgi:uncharacterized protein YccT (UPF0319 family)